MLSVLLVEDDDGDALIVDDLLSEALPDTRIIRSRRFSDALEMLDSDVDCVLLDLKLPDAEGIDTVVRLRQQAPDTPLIVLTGLDHEAAGVAAVDAGAQDYLVKGEVDGTQLARALRYSIVRRQAADAQQQLRLADVQSREMARLERGLAPRPLTSDSSIWIASRYCPGRDRALLGGDFLDIAETADGRLRAVVGDVCGHGPDEAAVGVCLRAAWRALAVAGVDGQRVVHIMEQVLVHEREIPLLFTTLCTLEIDPGRTRAHVIRAGHPPPVLIDGTTVATLSHQGGGPPIGLDGASWSTMPLELPPGWAMLLYTDGIIEGKVAAGPERLGADGVERLIREHIANAPDWRQHPEALLDELVRRAEELNGGELSDDVAMLLIGSHAPSPESA
ncbi:MAG: PP2C family protein-serine/threonine phosphatase [Solirubrobacteraceae bacterium]